MLNYSEYQISLSDMRPKIYRYPSNLSKELDKDHIELTVNYKEERTSPTWSPLYRGLHMDLTKKLNRS